MAILDDIKTALRISRVNTAYDDEVQDLIDEAKADLALAGVASAKIDETDPLIKRAIRTYCKAHFGWNNPDADRLQIAYEMIRNHLSLSVDYIETAEE